MLDYSVKKLDFSLLESHLKTMGAGGWKLVSLFLFDPDHSNDVVVVMELDARRR